MEALRESEKIMVGKKCELFCLYLRLMGWAIVCLLTLGIGFLWLIPYSYASCASFYEKIKPYGNDEITT